MDMLASAPSFAPFVLYLFNKTQGQKTHMQKASSKGMSDHGKQLHATRGRRITTSNPFVTISDIWKLNRYL
jgi:hypothetical protein